MTLYMFIAQILLLTWTMLSFISIIYAAGKKNENLILILILIVPYLILLYLSGAFSLIF